MRIQETHYEFKLKLDKGDSEIKRNFHPAQIDWLLWEASKVWLKTNYSPHNKDRVGFEGTEHRIQDLKNLHIKAPLTQPSLVPVKVSSNVWELNLGGLTFEHLFTTRFSCTITDGSCTKTADGNIVQTDDLNDALKDPFTRPNIKFGKVLGIYGRSRSTVTTTNQTSGAGSIYIYTDGVFDISTVDVDYIKFPDRVWLGTYSLTDDLKPKTGTNNYIYQSGVDAPVSFDFDSHVVNEIVDIAVKLASEMIEDPNLVQLKQLRIQTNK